MSKAILDWPSAGYRSWHVLFRKGDMPDVSRDPADEATLNLPVGGRRWLDLGPETP